jgi:hypothetical protein
MQLLVENDGAVRCLYDESIALHRLGSLSISRGSHVEPDHDGHWVIDLAPASGPNLGPFNQRSDALQAERQWLETHWLC